MCKKYDTITCAVSAHHLRPDRIEPGALYFGKSLPVLPLSLPEFLRWYLLSRRLWFVWFVVCFGKLSLSDIPIRNNQAASDRVSAVAKVPSKWSGRRKRTEFRPCGCVWSVGCRSILLEVSNWEFLIVQLIYKGAEDFHTCSCFDGFFEEDGTNYALPGHPTPNTSLLWTKGFFMYRVFTCPNTGIFRINVSRQVKPRLVREPSVVQNARIFLQMCLKPSTVCHSLLLSGST